MESFVISILRFLRQLLWKNGNAELLGHDAKRPIQSGQKSPSTQGKFKVGGVVNRKRVLAGQG